MEDINNNNNVPNCVQPVKVDVQRVVLTMRNKDCIIFCRVSSDKQTGTFHISLEVQEQKGYACARLFHMRVRTVIKCVESAYSGTSCTIKSLISKNRGKNIILYNVSRFSRSSVKGAQLLEYALKNNVRLFFVDEGIIWDKSNQNNLPLIKRRLELAEEESRAIGKRVKDALAEKKRLGFFTGGVAKYGYKKVQVEGGKKLEEEKYEQAVIKFINLCKEVGTSVSVLNEWMKQLSPHFDFPITLEHNNVKVKRLEEPLSNSEIAQLLNDYQVTKRGSQWTLSSISSVLKRNMNEILEGLEEMEISTGFDE